MTLRRQIFTKGDEYRAKVSFMSLNSVFVSGEKLTFLQDGYSPYDGCFWYEFHSQMDGKDKLWLFHETLPIEDWRKFFEPI